MPALLDGTSLAPLSASHLPLDLDVIARWFQEKYNLEDCMMRELRDQVEEVLEWGSERRQREELDELIEEYDSMEYYKSSRIGSGSFGEVFVGYHRETRNRVAIKVIDLEESNDDIATIAKEIHALAESKMCPQLVNYIGSSVVGTNLWIIMEYVSRGSLLDQMKRIDRNLTEPEVAIVCREVLLGLAYLSSIRRVHRDIKAANILISDRCEVKLADFGASGELTETMTKLNTFVGSPYWMAPEVITEEKYDEKADIWSLGITCFEMVTGKPPHASIPPMQMISIIPHQPPLCLDPEGGFSKDFCEFVKLCLQRDPERRPAVHKLQKHPFILNSKPNSYLKDFVGEVKS
eukprot:399990_1